MSGINSVTFICGIVATVKFGDEDHLIVRPFHYKDHLFISSFQYAWFSLLRPTCNVLSACLVRVTTVYAVHWKLQLSTHCNYSPSTTVQLGISCCHYNYNWLTSSIPR